MALLSAPQAQAQQIVFDPNSLTQMISQWAKEAAQWVVNNKLLSSVSSATVGSGMAQSEANASLHQVDANQRTALAAAQVTQHLAVGASMTDKQTFCPRVMEVHLSQTADNATDQLENALKSATFWSGSGGGNALSAAQIMQQLCTMSLIGPDQGCPSPAYPQYANGAVFGTSAVTAQTSYQFPCSVVSTDGKGHLYFKGTPKVEEMPAIAAIWTCIIRHNDTGTPVSATTTASSSEVTLTRYNQLKAAGQGATAGDLCIKEVASRMAIGSSCTSGQLPQIFNANAQLCQQMQDKMQPADYTACMSGAGVSSLIIKQAKACRYGNPAHMQQKLSGVPDMDAADKNLDSGVESCDAYLSKQRDAVRQFQMGMRESAPAGIFDLNPAARSTH